MAARSENYEETTYHSTTPVMVAEGTHLLLSDYKLGNGSKNFLFFCLWL